MGILAQGRQNKQETSQLQSDRKARPAVKDRSIIDIKHAAAKVSGGCFFSSGEAVIRGSTVGLSNCTAGAGNGGGFYSEKDLLLENASSITVEQAFADLSGGCFFSSEETVITGGSTVILSNCTAQGRHGGGFFALKDMWVQNASSITVQQATAFLSGGGFMSSGKAVINRGSAISVSNCTARSGNGGGFSTEVLQLEKASYITVENAMADLSGGCFFSVKKAVITGSSAVSLSNCRAADGGGFYTGEDVWVAGASSITAQNATATQAGGGFINIGEALITGGSTLNLSGCTALKGVGGGFHAEKALRVEGASSITVQQAVAGQSGGCFITFGQAVIMGGSTVNLSVCTAHANSGGGFAAEALRLENASSITAEQATAGLFGGCFITFGQAVIADGSIVSLTNCSALSQHGGGIYTEKDLWLQNSSITMQQTMAGAKGGALFLSGSLVMISQSSLTVAESQAEVGTIVEASGLRLEQSQMTLDRVTALQGIAIHSKQHVCTAPALDMSHAAIFARGGNVTDGFLAVEGCGRETIELSGIHAVAWSGPLIKTLSPVVLQSLTVEYRHSVEREIIVSSSNFSIAEEGAVRVMCPACPAGVTFQATKGNLSAVSSPSLICSQEATARNQTTDFCNCGKFRVRDPLFASAPFVSVFQTQEYCMPCQLHEEYRELQSGEGRCHKCPPHNAWSRGGSSHCQFVPFNTSWLSILLGCAATLSLCFGVFLQLVSTPLFVVDAVFRSRSERMEDTEDADAVEAVTVQGPLQRLPHFMLSCMLADMTFCLQGTGLQCDGALVKASRESFAASKFFVTGAKVPFDCATSKGQLDPVHCRRFLTKLLCVLSLLAFVCIAFTSHASSNPIPHVAVTFFYCALPFLLIGLVLHPMVAWLLKRAYSRTPMKIACKEYLAFLSLNKEQPHMEDEEGQAHPSRQGLSAERLRGLLAHFEKWILQRNMHYVVSNVVLPLTSKNRSSFVALWGGRPVDYFVSHCWNTSFQHFVNAICKHAAFAEGDRNAHRGSTSSLTSLTRSTLCTALRTTYWVCSFANNQWDIEAELGDEILNSPFAQALSGGVRGVVMVLDDDVLPLTRRSAQATLFKP